MNKINKKYDFVYDCRNLIINNGLEAGSQLPYIRKAKSYGYPGIVNEKNRFSTLFRYRYLFLKSIFFYILVVLLNTNHNRGKEGDPIERSENSIAHAKNAWKYLMDKFENK